MPQLLEKPQLLSRPQPQQPSSSSAASSTPAPPPPPPPQQQKSTGPRRLLNDAFDFLSDDANAALSDASDFTVVGVLGAQGAGKSTLMSLLAGARFTNSSPSQLQEPPFAPQTTDTVLQAAHQTNGVELFVTPERLLLLDTQPLLSPSVLLDLAKRDVAIPADVQTHENLLELHSIRIALLILSSCHLVLIAHDGQPDPLTLRTLRVAMMLRHRIPDLSVLAQATPAASNAIIAAAASSPSADENPPQVIEYHPNVAFVFNNMPSEAFDPGQQATLKAALHKLFATASSSPASGPSQTAAATSTAAADGGAAEEEGDAAENAAETGLSLYWLPFSGEATCASHLGYRAEAESCRDELLALKRRPFARTITEREWLRGAGRMWELIRRSALLADYNKSLQKLHCYG